MKKFTAFLIIMAAASLTLSGCTSNSTSHPADDQVAPTSKPAQTMQPINSNNGSVSDSSVRSVDLTEYSFNPMGFDLSLGHKAILSLQNTGTTVHTFTVKDLNVDVRLVVGETKIIEITPRKTGTFEVICTIPGHKQLGMHGTISVQ